MDLRCPFLQDKLAVIACGDEDRYNTEVNPRTLPLQPGILLTREQHSVDTNPPLGLEWCAPAHDPSGRSTGFPLPLAPSQGSKRLKRDPLLDCRLRWKEGCYMMCGNATLEVVHEVS